MHFLIFPTFRFPRTRDASSYFYDYAFYFPFLFVGLLVIIVCHLSSLLTNVMDDRDEKLRHNRIAQHASVWRKKSQIS